MEASNSILISQDVAQARIDALRQNLGQVIQGKDDVIELLITAVIAGGSILMEDVPGVGKTTMAKALARSMGAEYNRIQFTPDLLPADILGSSIYNPVDGNFNFRPGPVFCNVLLADEINRASPRTQSALLEAMSEQQVTIEGQSHILAAPFIVIATENPVEYHGTYPLPEAQLDRFLVQLSLGYPGDEAEIDMLYAQADRHPLESLEEAMSGDEVLAIQQQVRSIDMSRELATYLVSLVKRTRDDVRLSLGVSPRASLMLFQAAKAAALVAGRDVVLPDDIQRMARHVLPHRLVLTSKSKYDGSTKQGIVESILDEVPVPV